MLSAGNCPRMRPGPLIGTLVFMPECKSQKQLLSPSASLGVRMTILRAKPSVMEGFRFGM